MALLFSFICLLFCTLCYTNYAMNTIWNLFLLLSLADDLDVVEPVCAAFVFPLSFTRVFVSTVAWAVHHEPFARLLICWRFSLLHFPMRTKTIFDDIPTYSVLDFPWQILQSNEKSEICNASVILEGSGKLNFYWWTWFGPIDSSGRFSFSFSHWFYRGSVGGQLTGDQCFVEPNLY